MSCNSNFVKRKNHFILSSIAILLIVVVSLSFFISPEQTDLILNNVDNDEEKDDSEIDQWISYKEINEDYVGQIIFDSGLINRPFVQAKSCYRQNGEPYHFFYQDGSTVSDFSDLNGNDVYIWMDFETMEYDYDDKGGSIFMDYRNELDDQNLIIYGRYFSTLYGKDEERIKAFTPLEKLLKEENCVENNKLRLVLENEVREYELFAVYKYDSTDDNLLNYCQYFRPNYNIDYYTGVIDENYYKNYIDIVNSIKLYKTGVNLTEKDRTLTLQTCMTPYENLFEVCVFKQIGGKKHKMR